MFTRISRIAMTIIALLCGNISAQSRIAVSQVCVGCLCETASGCDTNIGCSDTVCGPFGITRAYWIDAGRQTLNGEPISDESYGRCATDIYCAASIIENYMNKYSQDCNGDGVINCEDYIRIHQLGPHGCTGNLDSSFESLYKLCLQKHPEQ